MNTLSRSTAAAALLALAALAAPAVSQNSQPAPQRPAAQPGNKEQAQRPAGDQPDAAQAQRPNAAQQPAGEAPPRDAMIRKMAQEEAKHRMTLAKLERLRDLAEAKGQTERLTALADLLKRENDRFAAFRAKARAGIGDNTFSALEHRLAQGRGRGGDPAAARERAAQKAEQRKAAAQPPIGPRPETEPANGNTKPAEQPKNTGGEKASGGERGSNPK